MIVCEKPHTHMIKTDGSLWHGSSTMTTELERLGWRQVVNPKRTYYPEFDTTHPSYQERERIGLAEEEEPLLHIDIL